MDELWELRAADLRKIATKYKLPGRSKKKTKKTLIPFLRKHLKEKQLAAEMKAYPRLKRRTPVKKITPPKEEIFEEGKEKAAENYLRTLPHEIREIIALELDPESLTRLCHTSRTMRKICKSSFFWERKFQRDFGEEKIHSKESWENNYKKAFGMTYTGIAKELIRLYSPLIPSIINKKAYLAVVAEAAQSFWLKIKPPMFEELDFEYSQHWKWQEDLSEKEKQRLFESVSFILSGDESLKENLENILTTLAGNNERFYAFQFWDEELGDWNLDVFYTVRDWIGDKWMAERFSNLSID